MIDSPWTPDSEVPNYNPLGKIPVLILDDSSTLFDSAVIVEYIDSVAPNNKLMPESNRGRAEAKRWGAVSDGICERKERPDCVAACCCASINAACHWRMASIC